MVEYVEGFWGERIFARLWYFSDLLQFLEYSSYINMYISILYL